MALMDKFKQDGIERLIKKFESVEFSGKNDDNYVKLILDPNETILNIETCLLEDRFECRALRIPYSQKLSEKDYMFVREYAVVLYLCEEHL